MQSKNNKKRSAYWKGEKIILFFKRGLIVLSVLILITLVVLGLKLSAQFFPIKNIIVSGNFRLEDSEVRQALGLRNGESLFRVSFSELESRLKRVAWIKKAVLRKHFPDTIMVMIEEASPIALLRHNGHMFLIDTVGNILEEMGNKNTPFLPVISEIDPAKDRGGILEALKLINILSEKKILSGRESVEIALRPYGLELIMDGELMKVGFGEYSSKLNRWRELEEEIRKKNINVEYIDMRFSNRIIVKPLKEEKERR